MLGMKRSERTEEGMQQLYVDRLLLVLLNEGGRLIANPPNQAPMMTVHDLQCDSWAIMGPAMALIIHRERRWVDVCETDIRDDGMDVCVWT